MSNFRLFEIPEAMEAITEMLVDPETGEVLTEEEANKLLADYQEEASKKIEYICKIIKNSKAEAEALKAQKQEFEKRQKAAERKAESLKNYLKFALNGQKWKADDSSVTVSYRNNKDTVKIDSVESLPDQFFRCPHIESNVSKTAIKDVLLNGGTVPGAHLEDTVSVIIK